jgi:two-component sensor histidine kinase
MSERLRAAIGWSGRWDPTPVTAVGVGLACALASTGLRYLLSPLLGEGYSFVTYFLAVIGAAALAGGWGLVSALTASLLIAWYLFVPPADSFAITNRRDATALVVFVVNAGLSGTVAAVLRRTLTRLSRTEGRQALLIHELNHRVKNTLATVQSLALQTARTSRSYDDFQPLFAARLAALAAAHDLLTRRSWEGAELGALLHEVVRPHDPEARRLSAEGPPVALSANAAVTVSLALHELATNAVKHGSLAGDEGRVDVRWSCEDGRLNFEWRERGGRPPEPGPHGFGAKLLKATARELEAEVTSELTPEGLIYRWRVPLSGKVRAAA